MAAVARQIARPYLASEQSTSVRAEQLCRSSPAGRKRGPGLSCDGGDRIRQIRRRRLRFCLVRRVNREVIWPLRPSWRAGRLLVLLFITALASGLFIPSPVPRGARLTVPVIIGSARLGCLETAGGLRQFRHRLDRRRFHLVGDPARRTGALRVLGHFPRPHHPAEPTVRRAVCAQFARRA